MHWRIVKTSLIAGLIAAIAAPAAWSAEPASAGLLAEAEAAGRLASAEVFATEAEVQPRAEPVERGISWKTVLITAAVTAAVTAGVAALLAHGDRDEDPCRGRYGSWKSHHNRSAWRMCR